MIYKRERSGLFETRSLSIDQTMRYAMTFNDSEKDHVLYVLEAHTNLIHFFHY